MASHFERFLDAAGVSQTEIAKALNLDPSSISRKVSGDRTWKLPEVQALLGWLAARLARPVTYEELFGSPAEAATTDAEPAQEPTC